MAEFLSTLQISTRIEDIIVTGKERITLISPYLQISQILIERLQDANAAGVEIVVVYGKDKLKPKERKQLTDLSKLSLYFSKNLHAKCYFNEDLMVITSMNLYEFSEKNNREMGIGLERRSDKSLFNEAITEADSIIRASELNHQGRAVGKKKESNSIFGKIKKLVDFKPSEGKCIRCREIITYNVNEPLCPNCLKNWNYYKNANYQEKFCHECGDKAKTSMAKPICDSCI